MTTLHSDQVIRRKIRSLGQAHQPGVACAIKLVDLVVKLFIAIDHLAVAGLRIAYLRRLNLKANHLVGTLHKSTITSLNTIAEGLKRVSRVTFRQDLNRTCSLGVKDHRRLAVQVFLTIDWLLLIELIKGLGGG